MQKHQFHPDNRLPKPLDCETQALLRGFLSPIFEEATSWRDLAGRLGQKGYGLAFRQGRLVVHDEDGEPLCTGQTLGTPLRSLAARLGPARLRAHRGGASGSLS